MEIFVSWSGNRSHALAHILYDWLPKVLPFVQFWRSDRDIEAGQRSLKVLAKQLERSQFGIICVTPENVGAPWILYEAGAIGKSLEFAKVIPLILDLEVAELTAPLNQFQVAKTDRTGLMAVAKSINSSAGKRGNKTLAERFQNHWPELDAQLKTILELAPTSSPPFDPVHLYRSQVAWEPFNARVTSRFWACGTSLAPLCDRRLINQFINQGAQDIRILLPDTRPNPLTCSLVQLREYNRVGQVGRNQVRDAKDCWKSLNTIIKQFLKTRKLNGALNDRLRRYGGTMYSNVTISDKEAYVCYYGMTGSGDDSVTLHADKRKNPLGYKWIEREFLDLWNADSRWGIVK